MSPKILNVDAMKRQMAASAKAIGKLAPNKRLEQIVKVTFETEDGRTFMFYPARVWKLDLAGNLAYQIRGDYPDLEVVLPALPVTDGAKEKEEGPAVGPGVPAKEVKIEDLQTGSEKK